MNTRNNQKIMKYMHGKSAVFRAFIAMAALVLMMPGDILGKEIKFRTADDLSGNFDEEVGKGAFAIEEKEGGFLHFSPSAETLFGRLSLVEQGSPYPVEDLSAEAVFRFNAQGQSFGLIARVNNADSDCYLFLVTLGNTGSGILKIFKTQPKINAKTEKLIAQQTVTGLPENVWYRFYITIKTASSGKVALNARIVPNDDTEALLEAGSVDDENPPENGALNLRFYTADPAAGIDVKELKLDLE